MSNDPAHNPLTWDWNKVLIPYCDGGSFGGNNDTITYTTYAGQTVPLYFRGRRNLDAVIADLSQQYGLQAATELLLSGDSAGGLATYWALDYLASQLPRTMVTGAPDSGFFFNYAPYPAWAANLLWVVQYMNATGSLNQACVAAQTAAGADPRLCAFPEVAAPHIRTPLFVMNSRFDPALDSIVAGEDGSNVSHVNALGSDLLDLVNATVLSRGGNAAFITACHEHCGQWAQGQVLGPGGEFDDFNVTITGTSAIPALASWYTTRLADGPTSPSRLWLQAASYPCSACCEGGNA